MTSSPFRGKATVTVARFLIWIAAAASIAWSIRTLVSHADDRALIGTACLPLAGGVALFIVGAGLATRYQHVAFWSAVAVIGQAVTLQMIDAGRMLHYQHYRPLSVLWLTRPWLLAWVGAQSVAVATALSLRIQAPSRAAKQPVRPWQIGVAALLSLSTAATVSPAVSRYISELAVAAYLQLLGAATVIVVVMAFPAAQLHDFKQWFDGFIDPPEVTPAVATLRPDRMAWCGALWVTIAAAALNVASYQRHPHIKDEVVYLFHARYLAAGMLTMPAPPVPAAFEIELMDAQPDRWFCPVPPGWPAMLAVGVAAGVPWLVNPILGGLSVLLTFVVIAHLYDRRTARFAVLLLSVSPWYVFMAMSFMTHSLTLTCALLAVIGVIQARRSGNPLWALLAGFSVAGVSLIRPLEGIIVGAPIALWALGLGGERLKMTSLAALLIGTVGAGSLVFPYNTKLTGHPLRFPINAYTDRYFGHNSNAYGFGPDRGMGWPMDPNPGHSPLDATINADLNTFAINIDLFGWSTGSLIFVALLLCSWSLNRSDWLMLAAIGTVFAAYFPYYYSGGPDFGARYWYLMIVPLVALTVRGVHWVERVGAGPRASLAVLALCALSIVNYFPWRAIDKYYHYLDMRPDVRQLAKQHRFDGGLVLIRGAMFPDYESAAIENPLDLSRRDAAIYAWDRNDAARAETLRTYPDRPVWIVEGPTVTHAGYRIVEGPVPATALRGSTP